MVDRSAEGPEIDVPAVLGFWFGGAAVPDRVSTSEPLVLVADSDVRERWFGGGEDFDREIERQFGALLPALEDSLRSGAVDVDPELLGKAPSERLARILVLDQFSRNLYRGSAAMFATDDLALRETLDGQEQGIESSLGADARAFFLMPLMHSEDPDIQKRSVASFSRLVDDSDPTFRERAQNYLDFAEQHRAIVDRFGRYPHRNELLGRESTAQERSFLDEPGSSF